jgi:hypothetical protein
MTTAPERPRAAPANPRQRRRARARLERNEARPDARPVTYCGMCAGHREIWCDGCCGFAGCERCGWTLKRPCPTCVGGDAERIYW